MRAVSIVLPCYNEAGNLHSLVEDYRAVARDVALELILVDNGSTDHTPDVIATLLKSPDNPFLRSIRVPKNIGYGHGIKTGLQLATSDWVGYSHADRQCSPQDIVKAVSIIRAAAGPCFVKGRRTGSRPALDLLVTFCFNRLARFILGVAARRVENPEKIDTADLNAQPKLFPKTLVPALLGGPDGFALDVFALWQASCQGLTVFEFDVFYHTRVWGRSKLAANPLVRLRTAGSTFCQMVAWRFKKVFAVL